MNTPITDSIIKHYEARGCVMGKERRNILRQQNRKRYMPSNTRIYRVNNKSEFCLILKQTVEVYHCSNKRKGVQ